MIKENTYDLLIYVYEEFIGSEFWSGHCTEREEQFIETFHLAGYGNADIEFYVDWFNQTFAECDDVRTSKEPIEKSRSQATSEQLNRFYTEIERQNLGESGALFLETLVVSECISIAQRELIIERTMAINAEESIEIDQLKWLTLMIVTNQKHDFHIEDWQHQFIVNWSNDYEYQLAHTLN